MKPMICVFLAPSDRHAQRPLVWSCFQVRGKLPFSSSDNVSTATQSILLVTTAPRFRSSDPVDTFHCNKFASYNVCNKQGSLWTLILLHDCWARETIQALVLCGGRRQQHYLFNGCLSSALDFHSDRRQLLPVTIRRGWSLPASYLSCGCGYDEAKQ